ncbi:schlafen-like protein 1 [Plakobranchus ocellatus]|uniref:Schlafen-like protein 1 n=1 Tax=Plakobranchus ocellatus TaxID=259542 RepID=A0AAV4DAU9_9GAST|nr:schlafen-like protein 1 [Plakobranchus ocellatus]
MPQSSNQEEFGFFIGPLKKKHPDKIANRLFRLLNCVGIKCSDVTMISVNPHDGFARVQLLSDSVEDYALKALQEVRAVMDLYDLRLLTEKPQNLMVERIGSRKFPAHHISNNRLQISKPVTEQQRVNKEKRGTSCKPEHKKPSDEELKLSRSEGSKLQKPHSSITTPTKRFSPAADPQELTSESEDNLVHVCEIISLSRTSSSSPSPASFEELEEEDLEDYSESKIVPKMPAPKSTNRQTSENSSSSSSALSSCTLYGLSNQSLTAMKPETVKSIPPASRSAVDNKEKIDVLEANSLSSGWKSVPHLAVWPPGIQEQAVTLRNAMALKNDENFDAFQRFAYRKESPKTHGTIQSSSAQRNFSPADDLQKRSEVNGNLIPQLVGYQKHEEDDARQKATPSTAPGVIQTERNKPTNIMVHAKTSTDTVGPSFCSGPSFYVEGQDLNVSGANVYLDPGNIVLGNVRKFRLLVGRRVCALLNSGGGVLYFGVDPSNATVKGLPISHKYEDALRLDIDRQIKLITPLVPTSAYKVNFVNVMLETGHLIPDVRVLVIEVMNPSEYPSSSSATHSSERDDEDDYSSSWPSVEEKYRFKEEIYVWEDGSAKISF